MLVKSHVSDAIRDYDLEYQQKRHDENRMAIGAVAKSVSELGEKVTSRLGWAAGFASGLMLLLHFWK